MIIYYSYQIRKAPQADAVAADPASSCQHPLRHSSSLLLLFLRKEVLYQPNLFSYFFTKDYDRVINLGRRKAGKANYSKITVLP